MRYALRFIAGRFEGGEFPIKPNREVIIGRGSEHDMVLDEEMVSRAHAKIETFHGRIVIRDLKSTNGTYVNGARTESTVLQAGDRILVGSSVMELVSLETQPPKAMPEQVLGPRTDNPMRKTTTVQGLLEGRFPSEISLDVALEKASSIGISGILSIAADDGELVDVFLEDGRYHSIKVPSQPKGKRAFATKRFYRLMRQGQGEFRFQVQAVREEWGEGNEDSIDDFLARGRAHNEALAPMVPHIPELTQGFELTRPLTPSLSELSVEALDTLQLLHNETHLGAVLDRSDATDLETIQDLLYLIQNGYITPC